MKKIIYGWVVFLTMPLTVIGYSKLIDGAELNMATQVLLFGFALRVVVFQFIMTTSLVIQGWKEQGLKDPFSSKY